MISKAVKYVEPTMYDALAGVPEQDLGLRRLTLLAAFLTLHNYYKRQQKKRASNRRPSKRRRRLRPMRR